VDRCRCAFFPLLSSPQIDDTDFLLSLFLSRTDQEHEIPSVKVAEAQDSDDEDDSNDEMEE
jgi:hypothetical protein